MSSGDLCLKWNDHHHNFFTSAEDFCGENSLCDVTLSAGGSFFHAHKLVLSICSSYFKTVFSQPSSKGNLTIIYLKGVEPRHMELILSYMYRGEVNVKESELMQLLSTASDLQIKGLSEMQTGTRGAKAEPGKVQNSGEGREGVTLNTEPRLQKYTGPQENRLTGEDLKLERHQADTRETGNSAPANTWSAKRKRKCELSRDDSSVGEEESPEKKGASAAAATNHSYRHVADNCKKEAVEPEYPSRTSGQQINRISQVPGAGGGGGGDGGGGELMAVEESESYADNYGGEYQGGDLIYEEEAEDQTAALQKSYCLGEKKAYPCDMCEMSFNQKWLLKRHWRTHTRERPFRCSLCSRTFSLRDSCIRHIRTVHKADMEVGELGVGSLSAFCQYEEAGDSLEGGAVSGLPGEIMYGNEALAISLG